MKIQKVKHQRLPYMEGSRPTHVFTPAVESASPSEALVLISGGFGSTVEEYIPLARKIAEAGISAAVVDTVHAAPNATSQDPFTLKADVLRYATDSAVSSLPDVKRAVWVGHSMAAAVQAGASANPPDAELAAILSLHGAGSGKISLSRYMLEAPRHLKDTPRQLIDAATISVQAFINTARNPGLLRDRFDFARHRREYGALRQLEEGHNAQYYQQAMKAGIRCVELVGPRDLVIRPESTRRIMEPVIGAENVIDVHAESGHFSPQTHPRATARTVIRVSELSSPHADSDLLPVA